MSSSSPEHAPRPRRRWLAPAAIIAAACALAAAAGWRNSATNDEPYHILASYAYVHDGVGDLNPEHPPLVKLLAGLAIAPLGLRGTEAPPVARLLVLAPEVRRFLYANTAPPQTILTVARLAMLPFLGLLLLAVYLWASDLGGRRAGLLALLATAFQPLVLGHAFVVHTDIAAAAGWTWSLFLLHRWLAGRRRAWLGLGVALGVALLVKFSAVYLLPIVGVAVLWRMRTGLRARLLAEAAGAIALAGAVVIAGTWPAVRDASSDLERDVIAAQLGQWPGTHAAVERLQRLVPVSRPLAQYALGLAYVAVNNARGQGINFFLGRTSTQGFLAYFPVALALKTTLPFLLLALWGIGAAVRRREAGDALALLAAALYLLASLGTSYNIGARHLMPVLALLAIPAARRAAAWRPRNQAVLAAALVGPALLAFPHYIAHFSLLVGGRSHGTRYLNDSNLDWGQDWLRLADLARERGWRPIEYVYLGAAFPGHDLPGGRDYIESGDQPHPGLVAISSFAAAVGPEYLAALRQGDDARRLAALLAAVRQRGEKLADVGGTIRLYRLRE